MIKFDIIGTWNTGDITATERTTMDVSIVLHIVPGARKEMQGRNGGYLRELKSEPSTQIPAKGRIKKTARDSSLAVFNWWIKTGVA